MPQTAADLALRALELTPTADPAALSRAVAATEALTAAGRLDQAARPAHDTLAKPLPPVAEAGWARLSSVPCARGQASDAAGQAEMVLAKPQLPDDLREEGLTAHACPPGRARTAGPLPDTILADPSQHDDHTTAAALAAARSSPGTTARSAKRSGCCVTPPAAAGSPPMPAIPSRCSRSLPPLSTSASSTKPTASCTPPTTRRCTASQPRRACPSCAPASTRPTAAYPPPPPRQGGPGQRRDARS